MASNEAAKPQRPPRSRREAGGVQTAPAAPVTPALPSAAAAAAWALAPAGQQTRSSAVPKPKPRQQGSAPGGGAQGAAGRGGGRGGRGQGGQTAPAAELPQPRPVQPSSTAPRGDARAPRGRGERGDGPGPGAVAVATAASQPPRRAARQPVVPVPSQAGGGGGGASHQARPPGTCRGSLAVPRDLHRSRAEEVAARVYEALPVASVTLDGDSLVVTAGSSEVVETAQLLLETLVGQQLQLQRRFGLKDRLADDVSRVQAEIEAGLRCEFTVDPELLGLVIGSGGANVRRVTEETKVDRIVIDRQASVVRIVGHRAEDVARARELLEVCSLYVPIPEDKVGYIVGKEGKNINEIISRSGLVPPGAASMDRERGAMRVQGSRAACEKARLLINAQLEFLKQAEREQVEVETMRRELESMQTSWGEDSTVVYRGGGGGGGGGGGHHHQGGYPRGGGGGQYRGRDPEYMR